MDQIKRAVIMSVYLELRFNNVSYMTYLPKKSYSVCLGRYISILCPRLGQNFNATNLALLATLVYVENVLVFRVSILWSPMLTKGTRMSVPALRDMKRGAPGGANKPRLNCAV